MNYLLDTSAWIEYFDGSDAGKKVWEIIKNKNAIFTLPIIIAEVVSKFKRKGKDYQSAYRAILSNSKVIDTDPPTAKEAGILYIETRKKLESFGLIDALIVCEAKKSGATIITKDRHFTSFKHIILLK